MNVTHKLEMVNGITITVIADKEFMIENAQQFLDVVFNLPSDVIVFHKENFPETFFDLKTGLAGDILQKVVTYSRRIAIVGDFSKYESKSLRAFIYESNKSNTVVFVSSHDEALDKLSK